MNALLLAAHAEEFHAFLVRRCLDSTLHILTNDEQTAHTFAALSTNLGIALDEFFDNTDEPQHLG